MFYLFLIFIPLNSIFILRNTRMKADKIYIKTKDTKLPDSSIRSEGKSRWTKSTEKKSSNRHYSFYWWYLKIGSFKHFIEHLECIFKLLNKKRIFDHVWRVADLLIDQAVYLMDRRTQSFSYTQAETQWIPIWAIKLDLAQFVASNWIWLKLFSW